MSIQHNIMIITKTKLASLSLWCKSHCFKIANS